MSSFNITANQHQGVVYHFPIFGFLVVAVEPSVVDRRSITIPDIPNSCGVNGVVAGAQISLPTDERDSMELPSQCKAKSKALTS